MALKERYMVKQVVGNTDLTLEAKSGESVLIKDIYIYIPTSAHINCKTEKTTVGDFRVSGSLGSHLPFINGAAQHAHDWITGSVAAADETDFVGLENAGGVAPHATMIGGIAVDTTYPRIGGLVGVPSLNQKTILGLLGELGVFKGYPVAEGETFLITGAKGANSIQVVVYEVYDAGDQISDMENGSTSTKFMFINYGNTGATIATTATSLYDTAVTPAEFPDFPYGAVVPAKYKIGIAGILASDFAPHENDGTDSILTQYLKLVRGRVTLFDEDRNGILLRATRHTANGGVDTVGEGQSLIGNYSDVDMRKPLLFVEPIEFLEGEELNIYLTTLIAAGGKNLVIADQEIGLICLAEKLS